MCQESAASTFKNTPVGTPSILVSIVIIYFALTRFIVNLFLGFCTVFVFNDNLFDITQGMSIITYLENTYKKVNNEIITRDDNFGLQIFFIFNMINMDGKAALFQWDLVVKLSTISFLIFWKLV
eukprot:CAMPEP_0116989346 /NCGR_PEP_ID=MMETSP0467-20121206/64753_1 /TAXON_ID=283647 /ORGANISM="Mesodinium pulex, Strain SPMC105" /LENGTH=123 /DNA_ID=CAMNT_0004685751 /DNA_START=635 /DNA_END=1006 /DNA_ORIENTATION=-